MSTVVDVSGVPARELALVMGGISARWPTEYVFDGDSLNLAAFGWWEPADLVVFVRDLRAAALVLACTHSVAAGDAVLEVADAITEWVQNDYRRG